MIGTREGELELAPASTLLPAELSAKLLLRGPVGCFVVPLRGRGGIVPFSRGLCLLLALCKVYLHALHHWEVAECWSLRQGSVLKGKVLAGTRRMPDGSQ